MIPFADRTAAGRALATELARHGLRDAVIFALPRGGVPVAFEIARALGAPLDLVLVRKIGAPGFEELAIGAIAEGPEPVLVTDLQLIRRLRVPEEWVAQTRAREMAEMERRRAVYLRGRTPARVTGRVAVLVDDGLATGATMLAAVRATRRRNPARLIVAVPVGAPDSVARIAAEADEVVCLHMPEDFGSVGQHYRRFPQLRDEEVTSLLDQAADMPARKASTSGDSGAAGSSANS